MSDEKFDVICPHCGTVFHCTPGGVSLHCWDYKTDDGRALCGILETGMLECLECGKEFKDQKWT